MVPNAAMDINALEQAEEAALNFHISWGSFANACKRCRLLGIKLGL